MRLIVWPMGKITMKLLNAGIFAHHTIMGYVDNNSHKKSEIQKIGGKTYSC